MISNNFLFALAVTSICWQCIVGSACSYSNSPNYRLEWGVDGQNKIQFLLTYIGFPYSGNGWLGIGFGNSMNSGLDVIVIRIMNSNVVVTDEFVQGYQRPFSDAQQDIIVTQQSIVNGVLRVRFWRPVITSDTTMDLNLSGCGNWNFVTVPGRIYDATGAISKHPGRPASQRVCLNQCIL
uniref:DOMON domain-containing protein n=1 Tax=Rhabditophanes sp. KR3021 TaxID=114890 RepID=A0AC35U838_9BILA